MSFKSLRKDRVLGTLIVVYMLVSAIGWVTGPTQVKTTDVGVYTTKGYKYCIKIATGSNKAADYLGV